MGTRESLLVWYRLVFAIVGMAAVLTEITVLLERGTFVPANFFSFFTIQSNLLAAIVLLAGAVVGSQKQYTFAMWRGAATLYMTMTGIIFALLLSGLDAGVLTAVPWDNTVLHYIMPIVVLADWLLVRPGVRISFRRSLVWLLYPMAYLAYTLVRGHIVHWYPYPFLNVSTHGYGKVVAVSLAVAALVAGLAWVLSRLTRTGSTA